LKHRWPDDDVALLIWTYDVLSCRRRVASAEQTTNMLISTTNERPLHCACHKLPVQSNGVDPLRIVTQNSSFTPAIKGYIHKFVNGLKTATKVSRDIMKTLDRHTPLQFHHALTCKVVRPYNRVVQRGFGQVECFHSLTRWRWSDVSKIHRYNNNHKTDFDCSEKSYILILLNRSSLDILI